MSPRKRADNKKMIGFYLEKETYAKFQEVADYLGLSMTAILTAFIIEQIDNYERKRANRRIRRAGEKTAGDSKGE